VVLASTSPRRRDLLGRLGLPFVVVPSGVEEEGATGTPAEVVLTLARAKAAAVAAGRGAGLVIGSDTVVVLGDTIIGKPGDAAEARATLRRLRGAAHTVYTGLAVIDAATGHAVARVVSTIVVMADYDEAAITAYVATGEPLDKAGSYAAQGRGAALIARVAGCHANVVGLPLCATAAALAAHGLIVPAPPPVCTLPDGRPCPRLADEPRLPPRRAGGAG
jgi:septum formation protein